MYFEGEFAGTPFGIPRVDRRPLLASGRQFARKQHRWWFLAWYLDFW
jgi:hypothetical protein